MAHVNKTILLEYLKSDRVEVETKVVQLTSNPSPNPMTDSQELGWLLRLKNCS